MRSEHPGENHARFQMTLSPLIMLMLLGFSTFRGLNLAHILLRSPFYPGSGKENDKSQIWPYR